MPNLPLQVNTYPPNGLDRADGEDGRPGTPTPSDAVGYNTSDGGDYFFEEAPDSPDIERAEQTTILHKFEVDKNTGVDLISGVGRGYLMIDSYGDETRVLSSRLTYARGDRWTFQVTAESKNFDTPPDEFEIETVELNPAAEKHPRYSDLTYQQRYLVRQQNISDAQDLAEQYQGALDTIFASGAGSELQQSEAEELLLKLHKGESNFYLPGFKVTWSQYFWYPQALNPGGYIEDPIQQGGLPAQFWSTLDPSEDPDPQDNIFSELANYNPNIYGTATNVDDDSGPDQVESNISWLRLCDTMHYQRTWYRITRSWIGAPIGHWDYEWYTIGEDGSPAPYQTDPDEGVISGTP